MGVKDVLNLNSCKTLNLNVVMCTTFITIALLLNVVVHTSAQDYKLKDPIIVTDQNWTESLEGEWMLEFMAPWCPACRGFSDTWKEFAGWGYDLDVSVGVVDVTENPGLSGRFLVTSLPTLYHVKNGVFRQYYGGRLTADLISLIDEKKWNDITPVAWYRDPKSIQMGIVGAFFKTAMFIRGIYNIMTEEYGIPEWACYLIFAALTIVIGLLLGLLLVVCCDNFFPAKYIPLPPERLAHSPVDVPADDADIEDDTEEPQAPDGGSDGSPAKSSRQVGDGDAGQSSPASQDNAVRRRQPHGEEDNN